jgi:hypothetical protein
LPAIVFASFRQPLAESRSFPRALFLAGERLPMTRKSLLVAPRRLGPRRGLARSLDAARGGRNAAPRFFFRTSRTSGARKSVGIVSRSSGGKRRAAPRLGAAAAAPLPAPRSSPARVCVFEFFFCPFGGSGGGGVGGGAGAARGADGGDLSSGGAQRVGGSVCRAAETRSLQVRRGEEEERNVRQKNSSTARKLATTQQTSISFLFLWKTKKPLFFSSPSSPPADNILLHSPFFSPLSLRLARKVRAQPCAQVLVSQPLGKVVSPQPSQRFFNSHH